MNEMGVPVPKTKNIEGYSQPRVKKHVEKLLDTCKFKDRVPEGVLSNVRS